MGMISLPLPKVFGLPEIVTVAHIGLMGLHYKVHGFLLLRSPSRKDLGTVWPGTQRMAGGIPDGTPKFQDAQDEIIHCPKDPKQEDLRMTGFNPKCSHRITARLYTPTPPSTRQLNHKVGPLCRQFCFLFVCLFVLFACLSVSIRGG